MNRFRSRMVGLITGLSLLLACTPLQAQDKPSPGAPAVQAPASSPFLLVSTSKLDQLVSHVSYLMRAVNQPEIGGMVSIMVTQYSRGLDRGRPIGVAMTLNQAGNPDPVIFLPIADMDGFLAGLAPLAGDPEDLGQGLLALEFQRKPVFLKKLDNWLVVGMQEELVQGFNTVPEQAILKLANQFDVGFRLDGQAVPAGLREMLISQIRDSFERGLERMDRQLELAESQAGDDEAKQKVATQRAQLKRGQEMQAMQLDELEGIINNLSQLVVGLVADQAGKQLVLESAVEFTPGSKLAERIRRTGEAKSSFLQFVQPGNPLSARGTDVIDSTEIAARQKWLEAMVDTVVKPAIKESDIPISDSLLNEFTALCNDSIREGTGDGAMCLQLQGGLHLVGATRVADGRKVAAFVQKAASEINVANYGVQVKFNAYDHQGTTIHTGMVPLPGSADPNLVNVLGEEVRFAIGTSDKALCVAIGPQCEERLKAALNSSQGKVAVPESPFSVELETLPILEYVQSMVSHPAIESMIQACRSLSENDMLIVGSRVIPNGMVFRVTLEEGLLKAVGAGAKAGQRNAGGF